MITLYQYRQALRAEINPYQALRLNEPYRTGSPRPRRFGAKAPEKTQPTAAAESAATIELRMSAIITT
jgi:hypothetical protein